MRKFTRIFMVGLALFICQVAVQAQTTTGVLTGTVTDPKGDVVPGASVSIKNSGTGSAYTATTNDKGVFTIAQLEPGHYAVTVQGKGFKKALAPDVKIDVAVEASLSVALEIGGV